MKRQSLLLLFWVVSVLAQHENYYGYEDPHRRNDGTNCYHNSGTPQRCVPDFINAAFDREVYVTNTCGEREPVRYCQQTGNQHVQRVCDMCDRNMDGHQHPAYYLTDLNDDERKTWWQSETMAQGIQHPTTVNLTLNLGKTFDITYIRLTFISSRPESFAIYKKTYQHSEWEPWAYFSGSCRSTYGLFDKAPILPGNEAMARCYSEFSDITPLTNGMVAFATLDERPSAEAFEESEVLQKWVTATQIRITLNRLNTYGDEVFRDPRVLESYYYAISDFAVGGRCHCNGHANFCDRSTGKDLSIFVCRCTHNTAGVDCEKCGPAHQDRPWRAATSSEANECLPCNCNGLSNRCFFDKVLYNSTGHGGHCLDCAGNTQGPNCEKCAPNHYRRPGEKTCTPCACDKTGSESQECDEKGQCKCKEGVTGLTCSKCKSDYYGFGDGDGCKKCDCDLAGSLYPCSPEDGTCHCKNNVEGQRCDLCRPGHFNLDSENTYGCTPCFCYGHSSNCTTSPGYYQTSIQSNFDEGIENWTAGSRLGPEEVQHDPLEKAIAVTQMTDYPVYYFLPNKYLGDLRFAYNRMFTYSIRLSLNSSAISESDIKIVSENGRTLNLSIASCKETTPGLTTQQVTILLHPDQGWQPRLRDIDFIAILRNVTEFSIRGTYSRGDVGYLYKFTLNTASRSSLSNKQADWVEQCSCGKEYDGQFCEFCSPGYRRIYPFVGPTGRCIPCQCNGHSEKCEPESGVCFCKHNTAGDDCSRCDRGYYGNATEGEANACQSCGCPNNGPCVVENGEIYCTECPEGSAGKKCEFCTDGYFRSELTGQCEKCNCNGNSDPNEIGSCDLTTGKCLKCINYSAGDHCEECITGFYGNATLEDKPSCRPCNCYPVGTKRPNIEHKYVGCDQTSGQCPCLPNVIGQHCNTCKPGFFNIKSGMGCLPCDCNSFGSLNSTCDPISGQCQCKPGVTGQHCTECEENHFGFSSEGCTFCDCDLDGSELAQCDNKTGQCLCKDNVEGRRCDQCAENWYGLKEGCLECDDCYELIGKRRDEIRVDMNKLEKDLQSIHKNPAKINDQEFENEMTKTRENVKNLRGEVENISTPNLDKLKEFLNKTSIEKQNIEVLLEKIGEQIDQTEFDIESFKDEEAKINKETDDLESGLDRSYDLLNQISVSKKPTSTNNELQSIAFEAQQTLNEIEQRYVEVEELVRKFKEASKNASDEAINAVFDRHQQSSRVVELEGKLNQLKKQFEDLSEIAASYEDESQMVYDQSIGTLQKAEEYNLPSLEYVNETLGITFVDSIRSNFSNIRKTAEKQVTKLASKTSMLKKYENEYNEIADLFKNTRHSNKKTLHKIDKANRLKQQGEEAKQKVARVFESIQKDLAVIEKFNEDPELVRQTFNKKLEEAAGLDQSLSKTERQLDLLEVDAKESQFKIEAAQVNANFAKQKADSYKQQNDLAKSTFEEIRQLLSNRSDDLTNLVKDLNVSENVQKDLEKDIEEDGRLSEEQLKEAIQINRKANTLIGQMDKSVEVLEEALTILNSFDPTSDENLAELENLLNEQETLLNEASLKTQIEKNEKLYKQLEHNTLKSELLRLQMEKNQLQEIFDNLPNKCFNEVHLEKE